MQKNVRFIGVAGAAGAGKDAACDLICELFGAQDVSTSEVVRTFTRHTYHLPADFNPVRDQLFEVANFLRSVDPAFLVKSCIFQADALKVELALISGLRTMGEAEALKAAGGIVVGVTADPQIRYDRIYARQRDTEAQKTYEQFLAQDTHENQGLASTGPGRGIASVTDHADVIIRNEGALEELKQALQTQLTPFLSTT